jgi:NitT/TauT family transport system substrate-binding protein
MQGRKNAMKFRRLAAALVAFTVLGATAQAETAKLRIAQQFGLSYLPLMVAKDQKLIEKQAAAAGLGGLTVEWLQISGASAMNDALLSGNLEFATAGVAPMILMWDKTRGSAGFIGIASLGSMPNVLITNNPTVRSLRDFTDKDRIALPSVKVGFQPILLQMAADREFGQFDKLDPLTVSLPHPDAAAAILSGRSEITAHFTASPFVEEELAGGKAHAVLDTYDLLGGPHTFNVVYATGRFVAANPKTIAAFVAALDEADSWIDAHPGEAARLYAATENPKLELSRIEAILRDKQNRFTTVPENTQKFADFEAKVGLIKHRPQSWQEMFQPGLHDRPGS